MKWVKHIFTWEKTCSYRDPSRAPPYLHGCLCATPWCQRAASSHSRPCCRPIPATGWRLRWGWRRAQVPHGRLYTHTQGNAVIDRLTDVVSGPKQDRSCMFTQGSRVCSKFVSSDHLLCSLISHKNNQIHDSCLYKPEPALRVQTIICLWFPPHKGKFIWAQDVRSGDVTRQGFQTCLSEHNASSTWVIRY